MAPHVKLVFETDQLSSASPSVVARCGVVYLEAGRQLTSSALISSWLARLPLPPLPPLVGGAAGSGGGSATASTGTDTSNAAVSSSAANISTGRSGSGSGVGHYTLEQLKLHRLGLAGIEKEERRTSRRLSREGSSTSLNTIGVGGGGGLEGGVTEDAEPDLPMAGLGATTSAGAEAGAEAASRYPRGWQEWAELKDATSLLGTDPGVMLRGRVWFLCNWLLGSSLHFVQRAPQWQLCRTSDLALTTCFLRLFEALLLDSGVFDRIRVMTYNMYSATKKSASAAISAMVGGFEGGKNGIGSAGGGMAGGVGESDVDGTGTEEQQFYSDNDDEEDDDGDVGGGDGSFSLMGGRSSDDKSTAKRAEAVDELRVLVDGLFFSALVWSVGGGLTIEGRALYSDKLRFLLRRPPLWVGGAVGQAQVAAAVKIQATVAAAVAEAERVASLEHEEREKEEAAREEEEAREQEELEMAAQDDSDSYGFSSDEEDDRGRGPKVKFSSSKQWTEGGHCVKLGRGKESQRGSRAGKLHDGLVRPDRVTTVSCDELPTDRSSAGLSGFSGVSPNGDEEPQFLPNTLLVGVDLRNAAKLDRRGLGGLPKDGSVYEFRYQVSMGLQQIQQRWVWWCNPSVAVRIPAKVTHVADVVVPTTDSNACGHMVRVLLQAGMASLVTGPPSTGKTLAVRTALEELEPGEFQTSLVGMSASTSPSALRTLIIGGMEKVRKSVLAPKDGRRLVVFVDDFNVPTPDNFGTQVSHELLRQLVDAGGWHEIGTRETSFVEVTRLLLVGALTPSLSRPVISTRLMRHFNSFSCPTYSGEALTRIYNTIVDWGVELHPDVEPLRQFLVPASVAVFAWCRSVLLPTPSKPMYGFSVRDLTRVFQGIVAAPTRLLTRRNQLIRLWMHEIGRVFTDRVADPADHAKFVLLQRGLLGQFFSKSLEAVVGERPIVFAAIERSGVRDEEVEEHGEEGAALEYDSDSEKFEELNRERVRGGLLPLSRKSRNAGLNEELEAIVKAGVGADGKPLYLEVEALGSLRSVVISAHVAATAEAARPLELFVPFDDALKHIARLSRVMRLQTGHMLILGPDGVGRRCTVRLAAHLCDMELHELRSTPSYGWSQWRDELVGLLFSAATGRRPVAFLVAEQQIRFDGMLSHVCELLRNGEVLNLLQAEDRCRAVDAMKKCLQEEEDMVKEKEKQRLLKQTQTQKVLGNQNGSGGGGGGGGNKCEEKEDIEVDRGGDPTTTKGGSKLSEGIQMKADLVSTSEEAPKKLALSDDELFSTFTNRYRSRLHVIVCLSTQTYSLNGVLLNHPELLEYCTVDWWETWPQEALRAVASHTIMQHNPTMDREALIRLADVCVSFHSRASTLADSISRAGGRWFHITTSRFLQLVAVFNRLVKEKSESCIMQQKRCRAGLSRLLECQEAVEQLEHESEHIRPRMEQKREEADRLVEDYTNDSGSVENMAKMVATEKAAVAVEVAETGKIKDECSLALGKALPALEEAISALRCLDKSNLDELKSISKPSVKVKLTMEAVCIMLEVKPMKGESTGRGRKPDDYWESARRLLTDSKSLMHRLEHFDKDHISNEVADRINSKYMNNPNFQPAAVRTVSIACEGLCKWVRALSAYNEVVKVVRPKKAVLRTAEANLAQSMQRLADSQARLEAVEGAIYGMRNQHKSVEVELVQLKERMAVSQKRLERANFFIQRLSGEQARWQSAYQRLDTMYKYMLGDVLLAAGFVSYLGFFSGSSRVQLMSAWREEVASVLIPSSERSMVDILASEEQLKAWVVSGLPRDTYIIQSALVVTVVAESASEVGAGADDVVPGDGSGSLVGGMASGRGVDSRSSIAEGGGGGW